MALQLIEGFDYLNLSVKDWVLEGTHNTSAYDSGRWSGNAWRNTSNSNCGVYKFLPDPQTTMIVGAAWFTSKTGSPVGDYGPRIILSTAALAQCAAVTIDWQTRRISLQNAAGTIVATTTESFYDWMYVELKVYCNGASGVASIHVNGAEVIADTVGNYGSTAVGAVRLRSPGGDGTNSSNDSYDDVYVVDTTGSAPANDFLGDVRVETILPDGAGNSTVWTPNTGDNYAAVDDPTSAYSDGDTTYVSSNNVGDKDTYTFSDLTVTTGTVYGVQTNLYARKDDANLRQLVAVTRISSTDYDASTHTLASGYRYYSDLAELDPATAAWTISSVNAAEFGVKVV